MVDAAVPSDGGHGPVDVLTVPPGRGGRAFAALALAASLCACGAGGSEASGPARDANGDAVRAGALVAALLERLPDEPASPAAEPRWPADLAFHPEARAESVGIDAVLEDARGRRHVLVRRFDRLSAGGAPGNGEAGTGNGESFGFRDVMRLSGSHATAADAGGAPRTSRRDAFERVTLGLAASDEETLRVRDASLVVAAAPGGRASCRTRYTLSEGRGTTLRLDQFRCPTGTLTGDLVLATSPTLALAGTLALDGEPLEVVGRAWMRRVWGEPPVGGGAVVFDRLVLDLDGLGLVDAARSRRRSGRGPAIASATLRGAEAGGAAEPLARVEWLDGVAASGTADAAGARTGSGGDGGDVPVGWTLRLPDAGVDVRLVPVLDVPVSSDALGPVWRGAVEARGTHEGIGFVEFPPLGGGAAGADDDTDS